MYLAKKTAQLALKAAGFFIYANLVAAPFVLDHQVIVYGNVIHELSPRLTAKEAKVVLEQEKKKLKINDIIELHIAYDDAFQKFNSNGFIGPNPKGEGYILGSNISSLTELLIKHELSHIIYGDVDSNNTSSFKSGVNLLKSTKEDRFEKKELYFSVKEPSVVIRSLTGIDTRPFFEGYYNLKKSISDSL